MVLRGDRVADVVEQRRDHHLVVLTIAQRPGGALEAVPVPVDPVSESRAAHRTEHVEQLVGQVSTGVSLEGVNNDAGVVGRHVDHVDEAHRFHRFHRCSIPRCAVGAAKLPCRERFQYGHR